MPYFTYRYNYKQYIYMSYYSKKDYKLLGFRESRTKNKMYDAILENKLNYKTVRIPFGSSLHQNYRDITGLNAYPQLIHNDPKRRKNYKARAKNQLRDGYYSAGFFSYYYLW